MFFVSDIYIRINCRKRPDNGIESQRSRVNGSQLISLTKQHNKVKHKFLFCQEKNDVHKFRTGRFCPINIVLTWFRMFKQPFKSLVVFFRLFLSRFRYKIFQSSKSTTIICNIIIPK